MGICTSCFKGTFGSRKISSNISAVDVETRRQCQAEAAEKRMQEQEHRGIKNVERVRRMQEKSERQADLPVPQDTPLKWQVR